MTAQAPTGEERGNSGHTANAALARQQFCHVARAVHTHARSRGDSRLRINPSRDLKSGSLRFSVIRAHLAVSASEAVALGRI